MKPKKAHKKINKIFDEYLNSDYELTDAVETVMRLKEALPELQKMLMIASREDTDDRRGWESYGFDRWKSNLLYVSDRWNCRFRLQWLIDLVDYVSIHYKDQTGIKDKLAPMIFNEELL